MKIVWKWNTPEWGKVFTAASHVNFGAIELKSHDLTPIAFKIFVQSRSSPKVRLREARFVYSGVNSTYQRTWPETGFLTFWVCIQRDRHQIFSSFDQNSHLQLGVFVASFNTSASQQKVFQHSEFTQFNQFDTSSFLLLGHYQNTVWN